MRIRKKKPCLFKFIMSNHNNLPYYRKFAPWKMDYFITHSKPAISDGWILSLSHNNKKPRSGIVKTKIK